MSEFHGRAAELVHEALMAEGEQSSLPVVTVAPGVSVTRVNGRFRYQYGPGISPVIIEHMHRHEFRGLVGWVVRHWEMDEEAAEDVVQQAFLRLWECWPRFVEYNSPFPVLRKMVQRAVFAYRREYRIRHGDISIQTMDADTWEQLYYQVRGGVLPEYGYEAAAQRALPPELQRVVEMVYDGASWERALEELGRLGYPVKTMFRVHRYQRQQVTAQREGWRCAVCGQSDVWFKTRSLCAKCAEHRQIERQQQQGFVCRECGRSDIRKVAEGLCQRCYAALHREGRLGALQRRVTHFVCRACGRSDRPHNAHGLCGGCYQATQRAQGKKSVGRKQVQCVECGQLKTHHARGLCDTCYQRWREQSSTKQEVS